MFRLNAHRTTIFICTAIVFTLSGCGKDAVAPVEVEKQAFDDLRTEIRGAIDDPAREAEAIALVDTLAQDLEALRGKMTERQRRSRQLNADYDTSRAEFDAFFTEVNREIRENRQRVTENHMALLTLTTPEEWAVISKARTQAMVAAIASLQAI